MSRSILSVLVIAIAFSLAMGCSNTGPVTGPIDTDHSANLNASHCLWGIWQFVADPEEGKLEITLLRGGDMHLNALQFLEPPPFVNLTLESLEFNGDMIEADIGLRHPFLGLTEFTGFDVCGILITNGSTTGFNDSGIRMAGDNDTRLLNYDGLSRWWNPAEFPVNNGTMFSYKDGLLGTADAVGHYNATLNGYKYFCDDLDNDDPIENVTLTQRGLFSAGKKNIRHYTIQLGDAGLIFNYAIDASWEFPQGSHPWSAPDDFGPGANRAEAWRISVGEIENTLWNDGVDSGGDLRLQIDVYDWFNADMNTVRVESIGNFAVAESSSTTGGGDGYSTYGIDIIDATPDQGEIPILISVISDEADYEGFISGTNTTAYFTCSASVTGETPPAYHWEFDDILTFSSTYGSGMYSEFDDISPAIIEESDGDIALSWGQNDINDIEPCMSLWLLARSTNNGATYGNHYPADQGTGSSLYRHDRTKVAPGRQNDAYATSGFTDINMNHNGMTYLSQVEYTFSRVSFVSTPYHPVRDCEVFVDSAGYNYGFHDGGNMIRTKHSPVPYGFGGLDWTSNPHYVVAPNAYCSHSRSTAMDSSDVVWIAYYNSAESSIGLSHSTDSPPHESWDPSTTVYTAASGISQVKNPSLWIDGNDIFHICYTRFGMVTGEYELVYTADDSSFISPPEQVIFGAPGGINDAHISVGEKFGKQVVIFTWEWNSSIYLYTLVDGLPIGTPQMIDGSDDEIDPDAILDAGQCDLHAIWATQDGDNRDLARRNGVLVED